MLRFCLCRLVHNQKTRSHIVPPEEKFLNKKNSKKNFFFLYQHIHFELETTKNLLFLLKKGYDTPFNIITVINLEGSHVKFAFDRYEADFQKGTTPPPFFLQRSLLGDWCCPSDKQVWILLT